MAKLIINGQEAYIDEQRFASFHGNSIFTTLRSKNGEALLWQAHWRRLSSHAAYFGYTLPEESVVRSSIDTTLKEHSGDQRIRVILNNQSHWCLSFEPYLRPSAALYEGVSIGYSKEQLHPQYKAFKTANSLPYQRAMLEANTNGVFDMLLLDNDGYVVDGARTSIMYYDGITLFALDGGLLGIMREEALSYATFLGIPCARSFLKPEALTPGQLLLANCLIGVVPVASMRYPVLKKLIERFRMDT